MIITYIILLITSAFQFTVILKRDRQIKKRDEEIDECIDLLKKNSFITIWCLKNIKLFALNNEDYETVLKCDELIKELEK